MLRRRRRSTIRIATITLVILSVLVVACAPAAPAPTAAPQTAPPAASGPTQPAAQPQAQPQGAPVKITVGWQPYYTGAWSALVVKELELWKKHLPPGSEVTWEVGLQGAIITNNMLAGKFQLGYVGDMPAIVASTKRDQADVRFLAITGWANQQCNLFVVRPDAPQFASPQEAIKWMDGKKVAVPKGSCTDRFAQQVFAKEQVRPAEYLNQSIEVITSNLRAGKLDAAVIWEPTVTRVGDLEIGEKTARIVATGADFGLPDTGAIIVRKDFLDQHPEVVKGWLKAEIEAQQFMISNYPKNACQIAEWAVKNTTGFNKQQMWFALYGLLEYSSSSRESGQRMEARLVFDPEVRALFKQSSDFLLEQKIISQPMPDDAIVEGPLQQAIKEMEVTVPLGAVPRHPLRDYPCG